MTTTTKSLKQRDAEHTPEFYNPRIQSILNWEAFYSFMIPKGTVKSKRIMEQKEEKWYPKQEKHIQRPFSGDKRNYIVSMENQREFSLDQGESEKGQ